MPETNYLAAFTPGRKNAEDTSEYLYYPPFVNFTQIGDRVKIIVRARDRVNDKGHPETIAYADMELPVDEFVKLIDLAKSNLRLD
jgi:hypothetical protein